MPVIRGLEEYLRSRGLIKATTLDTLQGTTIGFDGVQLFKNSEVVNEPLHSAVGGPPLALEANLDALFGPLISASITPIIVFGGLIPPRQGSHHTDHHQQPHYQPALSSHSGQHQHHNQPAATAANKFYAKRHEAWKAYESGQTRTASFLFKQVGGYVSLDFQNAIARSLDRRGLSFFRSPYSAPAQLAWLCAKPQQHAHAVYGGLDMLLYRVDRLVTLIDTAGHGDAATGSARVEYLDLSDVLQSLRLTHDQLVDVCLLAGYGKCRTFHLVSDSQGRFDFQRAVDVVLQFGSGVDAIQAHLHDPKVATPKYLDAFLRTRESILSHPVLKPGGQCEPLYAADSKQSASAPVSSADAPSQRQLHGTVRSTQVFGPCFPREVFVLLAKGVTSPQVLNNMLNGVLIDSAPSVDSQEFAHFLDDLAGVRSFTLRLLLHALQSHERLQVTAAAAAQAAGSAGASAYDHVTVANKRWYDPVDEVNLLPASLHGHQDPRHASHVITLASVQHALSAGTSSSGSSKLLHSVFAPLALAASASSSAHSSAPAGKHMLTAPGTIISMALLQSLFALGYANSDGELSAAGRAVLSLQGTPLYASAASSPAPAPHSPVNEEVEEGLLLCMQLLRMGYLNSKPLSLLEPEGAVFQAVSVGSDPDQRAAQRLVPRVCSLLSLTVKAQPWEGPIDRELAGFNAMVKALHHSLRNLVETVVVTIFLRGEAEIRDGSPTGIAGALYSDLARGLPLSSEAGTLLGLVFQEFMRGLSWSALQAKFSQATQLVADFSKGLQLWKQAVFIVQVLHKAGEVDDELLDNFLTADAILASRLVTDPLPSTVTAAPAQAAAPQPNGVSKSKPSQAATSAATGRSAGQAATAVGAATGPKTSSSGAAPAKQSNSASSGTGKPAAPVASKPAPWAALAIKSSSASAPAAATAAGGVSGGNGLMNARASAPVGLAASANAAPVKVTKPASSTAPQPQSDDRAQQLMRQMALSIPAPVPAATSQLKGAALAAEQPRGDQSVAAADLGHVVDFKYWASQPNYISSEALEDLE